LGNDIDGLSSEDYLGTSVSLSADGLRAAAGASHGSYALVLEFNGTEWEQLGSSIKSEENESVGGETGSFVSLSPDGTRVAVGAPFYDGGTKVGQARVFEWNSTDWVQIGNTLYGTQDGSEFGGSLSLCGERLAVGVAKFDYDGAWKGAVQVYEYSFGSWIQQGDTIVGERARDVFGTSVSLSSDGARVAIGATGSNNLNGVDSGHVCVYQWNQWNETNWVQLGNDIDGVAEYDESGNSVSMSADGNTVVIGSHYHNKGSESDSGGARVYKWNSSTWNQLGQTLEGENNFDETGFSVSISGDGSMVALGAPFNDGSGFNSGHVRLYRWNSTAWHLLVDDIDGEDEYENSGSAVSLSSDGTKLIVGAPFNSGGDFQNGHGRVFQIQINSVAPSFSPSMSFHPSNSPTFSPSMSFHPSNSPTFSPSVSFHTSSFSPSISPSPEVESSPFTITQNPTSTGNRVLVGFLLVFVFSLNYKM